MKIYNKNNMRTVGMSQDEYFELLKQIQKDWDLNSAIVEDAGRKIPYQREDTR